MFLFEPRYSYWFVGKYETEIDMSVETINYTHLVCCVYIPISLFILNL